MEMTKKFAERLSEEFGLLDEALLTRLVDTLLNVVDTLLQPRVGGT